MPANNVSTLNIENSIANDVLCYLSTARHSLSRDVIVMNAAAFYEAEKVLQAKEIIFNVFCEKIIVRKKSASQPYPITVDICDILNLIEKNENENSPKFLATNFDSLPPNGFGQIAAVLSSLRDELFALKSEVCQLKENHERDERALEDVCSIKQDVTDIKVSIMSLKSGCAVLKQTTGKSITASESVLGESSHGQENFSLSQPKSNNDNDCIPEVVPPLYSRALRSSKSTAVSATARVAQTLTDGTGSLPSQDDESNRDIMISRSDEPPNDGEFHQVRRRRPNRQRYTRINGAGQIDAGGLSAAIQAQRNLDIFVGGCSLDSTIEDITVHCVSKNISVKAVCLLETRAPWYRAYKLTVTASDRDKLLVPEAWPDGIFVRKFFTAKTNSSARNSNAT